MTNEDKFPGLGRLHKSVEALPSIAKWIKEHPVTEFYSHNNVNSIQVTNWQYNVGNKTDSQ